MVRLGVIGTGTFGVNHLRAYKQLEYEGKACLAAASDLDEERLARLKDELGMNIYTDYREMLKKEDLDGVSVVTPDFLHRRIAIDVLESGRHVLVEKPLDVTVEGCQEIIQAAERNRRLLQVDFHKRFDPYHIEIRRAVLDGKLGDPLYGYAYMEDRIEVPRDWFPQWAPKSSPSWFLGIHMYDLIRWIVGSDGKSAFARGQKRKLMGMGIDTYDSVQAQVTFENGAVVSFHTSWILPDRFESIVNQGIRLIGTEGIIEVDSQNRGAEACFTSDKGMRTYNSSFLFETTDSKGRKVYDGYGIRSIQDFAHNVIFLKSGGTIAELRRRGYISGEDGLQATKIALAVEKSLVTGEEVEID